jgi:hypothetical protein
MTAQQGKITIMGAEGLNGRTAAGGFPAVRCSPTMTPPREIVHMQALFFGD